MSGYLDCDYLKFRRAAAVVAEEFRVPSYLMWTEGAAATHRIRRVRRVALYLAHVACGVPICRVAKAAGTAKATAWLAMRAVEDRRDDPEFDARVQRLEERLLEAVA